MVAPATTYLKFSDVTALNSAIKEISKSASADKQSSIRKAIQTYAVNGMSSNFQSLLNHPEKNTSVLTKNAIEQRQHYKSPASNSKKASLSRDLTTADEVLTDQMVPDPNFFFRT